MTRINLIDPSLLHNKHLLGELHEITRVFGLARKAQDEMHKMKIPNEYKLGTNHVRFFYDKLTFISNRYTSLCDEAVNRGYNCNRIPKEELHRGIASHMFWDYTPTPEAIKLNTDRINERLPK
jgi:deoxyribonuclease (pyrimidine dimer)